MIDRITQFDLNILVFIKDHIRTPFLDAIMKFITHLADSKVCAIYPLIFIIIVCNLVLKNIIARPRPYTWDGYASILMIEQQSDKSFPSGHTVALFEMALCVAYSTKGRGKKWGIIAYVFAFVIAFSRLYVGVHYPTDVIGGIIIGTIDGILAILIVNFVYRKFIDKKIYGQTDV